MKFKKMGLLICALLAVSMLFSFSASAENSVFTQHKVVLAYDDETSMLNADVYISAGTAIVGYCSFTFDSNDLCLIDATGNAITTDSVPDFADDGSIYLSKVVTAHNGVVVTDVAKGSSKLIDPKSGHIMFAWYLPKSIPFLSPSEGSDVLIASFRFNVVSDITEEEFNKDTFWVAGNDVTDKVSGWYPGIVVLNDKQQQFNFDGSVEDGDLFLLEYDLKSLNKNNVPVPEEKEENPSATQPEKEEPPVKTEPEKEDTPVVSEPEKEDVPVVSEPEKEDVPVVSEPEKENENKPDTTEKDSSTNLLNPNNAFKADFSITAHADETTINVEWVAPSTITNIENYTVVLCDSNYNVVREIDIFRSSTSYTFKNLKDGFDYKLYFCADSNGNKYTSDIINISTKKAEHPEAVIYNVTYSAGKGKLYGISKEQVLFGEKLTKVPEVIAPSGKYFIGWSFDGDNLFEVSSTPIYSDYTLTAVYMDEAYNKPSGYITGYTDGTFKPNGSITRAEAAVLISRISPFFNESSRYCHSFTDCDRDSWYEKAVAFCSQNGFITGYTDGTFKPTGYITRAEFATILVRVYGFEEAECINVFNDIESHWACPYISRLYGAGIVKPDKNGNFRPSDKLSRLDAILMINACYGITPDKEAINAYLSKNGEKFSDLATYDEYFYDIMAATLKKEDYAN